MKPPASSVWPFVPPALLRRFALCALLLLPALHSRAQETAAPAAAPSTPAPELPKPLLRELSPGVYELGKMRLDKNANTLSFPARLNMAEGLLEYLICTPQGSTHESLVVTEVRPSDIHFAMLLLGAKGAGLHAPAPEDAPPGQINGDYLKKAPELKGDVITLSARWKGRDGKPATTPLEDWVLNTSTKQAAPRGPWTYTGSMFSENVFLAEQEGNIASLVTNPASLINNPRKGSKDDQVWVVNEKSVPAVETALEITISIQPAPAPAQPK